MGSSILAERLDSAVQAGESPGFVQTQKTKLQAEPHMFVTQGQRNGKKHSVSHQEKHQQPEQSNPSFKVYHVQEKKMYPAKLH